jgi:F0F1-type ATP synthase membrane subunit b/b'
MDSSLIAYSISFVVVLVVLYWKMSKQITALLQAKQQGIQEALQTAEYMNNISITALYEEAKKNGQIEDEAEMIRIGGEQKIASLFKEHRDFQEHLCKQLEQELDEHIQQINGQFVQAMKDEFSELITARLQDRLTSSIPFQPAAEQFVEYMRKFNAAQ